MRCRGGLARGLPVRLGVAAGSVGSISSTLSLTYA